MEDFLVAQDELGTSTDDVKVFKIADKNELDFLQTQAELEFFEEINRPFGISKNLFRLAFSLNNSALYKHPKFAMAAALTIYAASAQANYTTPTGAPLNTYTCIVAPSASGKNHFLNCVSAYINELMPELSLSEPRSEQAIRYGLTQNRSKLWLHDEFILKVSAAFKKQKEQTEVEKFELLLKLWGDCKKLEGSLTKDPRYRLNSVDNPRLSLFGTGTFEGLKTLLGNEEFSSQGHASRFEFVVSDSIKIAIDKEHLQYGASECTKTDFKIEHDILESLRKLSPKSLKYDDNKERKVSTDDVKKLSFTECGKKEYEKKLFATELFLNPALQHQGTSLYAESLRVNKTQRADYEHAIHKRFNDKLLRAASLNSLADDRYYVSEKDLIAATRLLEPNFRLCLKMIKESSKKENDPIFFCVEKAVKFLARKKSSFQMRDFLMRFRDVQKLSTQNRQDFFSFLSADRRVVVETVGKNTFFKIK